VWPEMKKIHKNKRVLIIATHPDDEVVGCGEKILSCVKNKIPFKIIIVTSSTHQDPIHHPNETSEKRENESKEMLRFIKGKPEDIIFLRANHLALLKNKVFLSTMKKIKAIIKSFKPIELYIPCYEGGNLEHDLTNFLVYWIFKKEKLFGKIKLFEYPEYTSRISFADFKKFKRFFFSLEFAPYFINNKSKVFYNDQNFLEEKIELLNFYKSQKPKELIKVFGFRDKYAKFEFYDYTKPPYKLFSLNSLIGIFIKRFKLYGGKIKFKDFKSFIKSIEKN
jgi:LmbE family N-acetylglucosaminyl deacetylase